MAGNYRNISFFAEYATGQVWSRSFPLHLSWSHLPKLPSRDAPDNLLLPPIPAPEEEGQSPTPKHPVCSLGLKEQ